ncbi:MAG: divergent polysaccharide deacetylase family protein [Candidatus Aminicenantes bacterium]|nr:divergent polysaccharide deacetylase family protein [Candidatus Aminicenantes bacterium]
MALLSIIGLDYINWTQGKNTFLFSQRSKPKTLHRSKTMGDIAQNHLSALSITPESIRQFWDSEQNHHLIIDLPEESYSRIKSSLENNFRINKAVVLEKEKYKDEGKQYHLWKVEGKTGEKLSLLFSYRLSEIKPGKVLKQTEKKNRVVIIVDDMGYNLQAINTICRIDLPLTVAIIPFSPLSQETAEIAHRSGLEIILHLPLESKNLNKANKMDGIILSGMPEQEICSILDKDLDDIPYARGVNNHMGSKATEDWTTMRIFLERLKEKNLYFVDSMTTSDSIAYKMAQSLDIPTARRHVFLDGELEKSYIKGQLKQLFHLAQKNGHAIGICHPSNMTLQILSKDLFKMQKQYGVDIVFASAVVR